MTIKRRLFSYTTKLYTFLKIQAKSPHILKHCNVILLQLQHFLGDLFNIGLLSLIHICDVPIRLYFYILTSTNQQDSFTITKRPI